MKIPSVTLRGLEHWRSGFVEAGIARAREKLTSGAIIAGVVEDMEGFFARLAVVTSTNIGHLEIIQGHYSTTIQTPMISETQPKTKPKKVSSTSLALSSYPSKTLQRLNSTLSVEWQVYALVTDNIDQWTQKNKVAFEHAKASMYTKFD